MDDEQKINSEAPETPENVDANNGESREKALEETSTADVQAMYDELGIKSTAPTGKTKGRPKADSVRTKDADKDGTKDSSDGAKKGSDDKGKSKDAPDSADDGDAGDETDKKGSKERKDSGEVSDESEETNTGVRKGKSKSEGDSERGSEEGSDEGDSGTREAEAEEDEGKRPGKSNPKIERRFQKLSNDVRERDERIAELERQINENRQEQYQRESERDDPEYSIDDFRRVRDEDGNIIDLDPDEAELAFRRWQDGFNQRKSEREARFQREESERRAESERQEQAMRNSAEAYDTLTGLLDNYPELDERSDAFDEEFSKEVMPLIHELVMYHPGTEPGNEYGNAPIISGLRVNPNKMLEVLNKIRKAKRNLPLNGVSDTVETRPSVSVSHSRSSDPNVNAANELYKHLGINKRI